MAATGSAWAASSGFARASICRCWRKGANTGHWKLKFTPLTAQTVRITAVDAQGNRIGTYHRDVQKTDAPVYALGLLFVTAVGYTVVISHHKAAVATPVANVKYTNGQPADKESEAVQVSLR